MVVRTVADFRHAEGCKVFRIDLNSPGGEVVAGIDLIRQIEKAREQGQIVEFHGGGLVASMATIVIAAGSPGHRYVYLYALVVVHGVQVSEGPFGGRECFFPVAPLTTERDKIGSALIDTMATLMSKYTGKPVEVTKSWMKCGNEQYGNGLLLVRLGLADHLE